MRHARAEYDRIQDPLNEIGEDEPVLLLRASDPYFVPMLVHYHFYLKTHPTAGTKLTLPEIEAHILLARDWQLTHMLRLPDVEPAASAREKLRQSFDRLLSEQAKEEALSILMDAVISAQQVLEEYITPGKSLNSTQAAEKVHKLLGVLDNVPLVLAQNILGKKVETEGRGKPETS